MPPGFPQALLALGIGIVVIHGGVGLRPRHGVLDGLGDAPVAVQGAGIFAVGTGPQPTTGRASGAAAGTSGTAGTTLAATGTSGSSGAARSSGTSTGTGILCALVVLETGVAGITADAHIGADLLVQEQPAAVLKDEVSAITLPQAAAAALAVIAHSSGN